MNETLSTNDSYAEYLPIAQEYYKKAVENDPNNLAVLHELVTEGFDSNQVWEQIQLLNASALDYLYTWIEENGIPSDADENDDSEVADEMQVDAEEAEQEDFEGESEQEEDFNQHSELEEYHEPIESDQDEPKKSIVDDDFFSLEKMEQFADMAEKRDIKMSQGTIEDSDDEENAFSIGRDLATGEFEFEDDEENANDITYADFFEAVESKKRRKRKDDMEDAMLEDRQDGMEQAEEDGMEQDEEELEDKPQSLFDDEPQELENLSKFEREQLKIQKEIEQLETENMATKAWTMKGEVNAKSRPKNSLLEEELDVEIAVKPPPVITEETTKTLEELILQRIKDKAFDDVIRKAPIKKSAYDPNRRLELNDEKSKKSLAEIYEDEYAKTQSKVKTEKDLELEKRHQEIESLMSELRDELDALSNFHYQPKAKTLEVSVVQNVGAIAMEEVIPSTVSDAKLAVPKEVYDGRVQKTQEELTTSEKTKLRQKMKKKIRVEKKIREAGKVKNVTQGQVTKDMAMKKLLGQRNVTIVVDPRKDKNQRSKAKTVGHGEKVGGTVKSLKSENLKL